MSWCALWKRVFSMHVAVLCCCHLGSAACLSHYVSLLGAYSLALNLCVLQYFFMARCFNHCEVAIGALPDQITHAANSKRQLSLPTSRRTKRFCMPPWRITGLWRRGCCAWHRPAAAAGAELELPLPTPPPVDMRFLPVCPLAVCVKTLADAPHTAACEHACPAGLLASRAQPHIAPMCRRFRATRNGEVE